MHITYVCCTTIGIIIVVGTIYIYILKIFQHLLKRRGFGRHQILSPAQPKLLETFAQSQQTGAATKETGTAAGITLDAEDAALP